MAKKIIRRAGPRQVRLGLFQATRGYLVALALQLATAMMAKGTTAWTTPLRGETSIRHCGTGWSRSGRCRVCEELATQRRHVTGRRKRVRLRASATFGTGADGGSGSTEPEDREVGGSQEMNSNQEGSAAKSFEDPEDEGEYYSLLGLDVGATPQAIKESYRGLVREVHPDANGSEASRARFQALTHAYDILSDPGKRSTYDQGLAMRRFVNKVKTGNWAQTFVAVASLGAVATSAGVSAGVKAAQPLAKDLARSLKDVALQTVVEDSDNIWREQQSVQRAKAEAVRKLAVFRGKAKETLAEAQAAEEVNQLRLAEQNEWNATLAESEQEAFVAKQALDDCHNLVTTATEVVTQTREKETEATEAMRKATAACEAFGQTSANAGRKISNAQAAVATAEQRVNEAVKALDLARQGLEAAMQQKDGVESQRDEVFTAERAARELLVTARKVSADSKLDFAKKQDKRASVQAEVQATERRRSLAASRVNELGEAAEAAAARALRLRTSAKDSEIAAQREIEAIDFAERQESCLQVQAAAARAEAEAAAAAAEEERARREREEAARAAKEALARVQAAEEAAGAATAAATAAAEAARRATADAMAVVKESQRAREGQAATDAQPQGEGTESPGSKPESKRRPTSMAMSDVGKGVESAKEIKLVDGVAVQPSIVVGGAFGVHSPVGEKEASTLGTGAVDASRNPIGMPPSMGTTSGSLIGAGDAGTDDGHQQI